MAHFRYALSVEPMDTRLGWRLGNRVVPRGYTIRVAKYFRWHEPEPGRRLEWRDLSDTEVDDVAAGAPTAGNDWAIGLRPWLELDVVSSPTEPPRCVALRAPNGISTPELRFPLAGVVTEASAAVASADGTFLDPPQGLEYGDAVWEASRARGRKRPRRTVTPERLEEVARVASEHPRTPTAAVQHHFGISRGYARRLIKLAEATQ
jgi:hypothetical protein